MYNIEGDRKDATTTMWRHHNITKATTRTILAFVLFLLQACTGSKGKSLPHIIRPSSTSTELPPSPSATLRHLHRRKSPPLSPRLQSACFSRRRPHRCRRRHTATVVLLRCCYRCQSPLPPQRACLRSSDGSGSRQQRRQCQLLPPGEG